MKRYLSEKEKAELVTSWMEKHPVKYKMLINFLADHNAQVSDAHFVESTDMRFHLRSPRDGKCIKISAIRSGLCLFITLEDTYTTSFSIRYNTIALKDLRDRMKVLQYHPGVLTPEMKKSVEDCVELMETLIGHK